MCEFCTGEETIERKPELLERIDTTISLSFDEDMELLKVRLQLGSIGYTLPIQMNYCLFCGRNMLEKEDEDE